MTVELTDNVKAYMRLVAGTHIVGADDDGSVSEARDEVWAEMSARERDDANALVLAIFDP